MTLEETKNNIANSPWFHIGASIVLAGSAIALAVAAPSITIAGISLASVAAVVSPMIKDGLVDAAKQIFNYVTNKPTPTEDVKKKKTSLILNILATVAALPVYAVEKAKEMMQAKNQQTDKTNNSEQKQEKQPLLNPTQSQINVYYPKGTNPESTIKEKKERRKTL